MAINSNAECAGYVRPSYRIRGVNWLGIGAIIKRDAIQGRYYLFSVVGPILQTLMFALVFRLSSGFGRAQASIDDLSAFVAPGLILSAGMISAYQSRAYGTMDLKITGSFQDFLVTPLYPHEVFAAFLGSELPGTMLIFALTWALLLPLGAAIPAAPVLFCCALVVGALLAASIGIFAALMSRHWDGVSGFETFLFLPFLFLSGTFFTAAQVPANMRVFLEWNPFYHLIHTLRTAMLGGDAGFADLTLPALLFMVVAVGGYTLLRCGYKLKS